MTEPPGYFRSYHRFPVAYPVIFGGAPFVGEGTVSNLSLTGCLVSCEKTVLIGCFIKMSVFMPNPTQSLFIELGKVRWVQGDAFGVEFIRLPTFARHRLDRILWERMMKLLEAQSTSSLQHS